MLCVFSKLSCTNVWCVHFQNYPVQIHGVCIFRTIADFPKFLGIAVEAFLTLCDDAEADIRMVADECLNRTIKVLHSYI